MAIKLRVISDQHRILGANRSRIFGVNGGTVGRAPDNDWVLPDPKRVVSGHHFEVQYHGGGFWLRDTSTNGVFINESDDPASAQGRVELRDGDRLRMGEYEILVSVDSRIDFLPSAGDEDSAIMHMDADIGHQLDLGSLLKPRDPDESGPVSVRNAPRLRLGTETRESLLAALQSPSNATPIAPPETETDTSGTPAASAASLPRDQSNPDWAMLTRPISREALPSDQPSPDWAMRTRPISRDDLADVLARRQNRSETRERNVQFHRQASNWQDLGSAVQAFCRGAGIEPKSLSAEAQAMLPLIAGQLVREAVVGLNDIAQARAAATIGPRSATPPATGSSSNPLRTSTSVEQAIQRLFESHGRMYGGPVESLRDVLQEAKEHESATLAAMRAALGAVLQQLSPSNVADKFEQGRARSLAPGQDPRPKYWEHYADFYRLLTQQGATDSTLPHAFVESFSQEYARARAQLRAKKQDGA